MTEAHGRRDHRPAVEIEGVAHRVGGAQAAIVGPQGVLLLLRPWPPGWELPGGHCDQGEDPAACAVREALEETGLDVRVTALVGVYYWAGLRGSADVVYRAEVVGGTPRRSIEAVRLRWYHAGTLPRTAFPWIPTRVADTLALGSGAAPVVRVQRVTLRHVLFFGSTWAGQIVDVLLNRLGRRRRG